MVADTAAGSSASELIQQLSKDNSTFLETQRDSIIGVLEDIKIVSFYETHKTPVVLKVRFAREPSQLSR